MKILVDTNRLTDFFRGDRALGELMERADQVWIPFVVLAELRAGFLGGSRSTANQERLSAFLRKPGIGVLFADNRTTQVWAALLTQLRKLGRPIPSNDLWIAALAVQHEMTLLTRDRHFGEIPQLDLR